MYVIIDSPHGFQYIFSVLTVQLFTSWSTLTIYRNEHHVLKWRMNSVSLEIVILTTNLKFGWKRCIRSKSSWYIERSYEIGKGLLRLLALKFATDSVWFLSTLFSSFRSNPGPLTVTWNLKLVGTNVVWNVFHWSRFSMFLIKLVELSWDFYAYN